VAFGSASRFFATQSWVSASFTVTYGPYLTQAMGSPDWQHRSIPGHSPALRDMAMMWSWDGRSSLAKNPKSDGDMCLAEGISYEGLIGVKRRDIRRRVKMILRGSIDAVQAELELDATHWVTIKEALHFPSASPSNSIH